MDKLGYLQHFDHTQLPNVKQNLLPALRNPAADPKRAFTVPWQSGMTGLIVRTDLAPGVDEIADLFDPKYKGKVTMLTEMRDTVPMTLKSMGIDPDTASEEEWLSAVDKIAEAAESGQVRRFTGNDYIKDLPKGDSWIALGWSGDAVQLQKESPDIRFIMPKEGCMLWSTSMEIPVGAPNPQAAQAFIDFVYDPEVQADIAEWVNYVTPVTGVKEILKKRDPALAKNQLIFPSEEYTANCSFEPVLGGRSARRSRRHSSERSARRCGRCRLQRSRPRRSPAIQPRRCGCSASGWRACASCPRESSWSCSRNCTCPACRPRSSCTATRADLARGGSRSAHG